MKRGPSYTNNHICDRMRRTSGREDGSLHGMTKGLSALLAAAFVMLALASIPCAQASQEYDPQQPANLSSDQVRAQSAIVIEMGTGEAIFEKNADDMRFPASTSKIMTVLLGILMGNPDDLVTVSQNAVNLPQDASRIPLVAGEQLLLSDLLRMTMVASGNDGAIAIAEHISGSESAFVGVMNDAAMRFGCTGTRFNNAHGYHDENHYSTARDLARIAKVAMDNATFREIAALTTYSLPRSDWSQARKKTAQNAVFSNADSQYFYPSVMGIKTGYHQEAGYCFVGAAEKDGVELISVVLKDDSPGRWRDTVRLMEFGFAQYITTSIEEIYHKSPKTVEISSFALDDPELGRLELAIRKLDPLADDNLSGFKDKTENWTRIYNMRTSINFSRKLDAPIEAGDIVGIMTYTPEGADALPVEYELVASRSIARRASLAPTYDEILMYTQADPNPFPRFSLELLLLLLAPVISVILLSQLFIKLFSRKKKPKIKRKTGYSTRYYR